VEGVILRPHGLMLSGDLIGDRNGLRSCRNHWEHTRAQGVAHHEELVRTDAMPGQEPLIGDLILLGDDFDALEQRSQTGARDLALRTGLPW
jgi:hypothetical protein